MKKIKTIFDFLGQVFFMFGITVAILLVLCTLFGAGAKEVSTMFSLGNEGLSIVTLLQYLAISVLITGVRFLFFNDKFLKNASITMRTSGMLLSIVLVMVCFIFYFEWFPVKMWQPWILFLLCFGVCFLISTGVAYMKERMENKSMEEALKRLKEEQR